MEKKKKIQKRGGRNKKENRDKIKMANSHILREGWSKNGKLRI